MKGRRWERANIWIAQWRQYKAGKRIYDRHKITSHEYTGSPFHKDMTWYNKAYSEQFEITTSIVDDIIDSGNTIVKCSEVLKKEKAKKIFVYATHGIFSEGAEKFKEIEKIFTTNTLYNKNYEKVEVISLTNLLAEAIYREAVGESLSELFE
ncbi:MAG: hypothetical protein QXI58_04290 [Candidatus Micrarchaeia archaeon]